MAKVLCSVFAGKAGETPTAQMPAPVEFLPDELTALEMAIAQFRERFPDVHAQSAMRAQAKIGWVKAAVAKWVRENS